MPYLFTSLVLGNVMLFGYFVLIHDNTADFAKEQTQLTQPISFENTSKHVPPIIGTKK